MTEADEVQIVNLAVEDVRSYQKIYNAYAVDFHLWFPNEHDAVLVIPDENLLMAAYGDEMDFSIHERVYGYHGYLSLGMVNTTARDKRQQTRFYRGGVNIIYCPVFAYFDTAYHQATDQWMMYGKQDKQTTIMSRSTCTALREQQMTEHSIKQMARKGYFGSFELNLKLELFRRTHNEIVTRANPLTILQCKSPHCFYCQSILTKVIRL